MYPYYIILFVAIILFLSGMACTLVSGRTLYSTTNGLVEEIGQDGASYYLEYSYIVSAKKYIKRSLLHLEQYSLLKKRFGEGQETPINIVYSKILPGVSKPIIEEFSSGNSKFCRVLMFVGLAITAAIGSSLYLFR